VEVRGGNLGSGLPARARAGELVETLLRRQGLRIERIVSTGQATPKGQWYDQEDDEWVLLAAGAARILIAGEARERHLEAGDWLLLPAHCRHHVAWTSSDPPAVWLAIHFAPG
jgi:cupin 2 domain-containing protein